ncbi:MAG: DNA primase [Armatimonadetes bacterium]|nr:DNA primase [Armatimonadota bacterium]
MAADREEIRDKNDVVSVIGEYIRLKKAGRVYKALCPFHEEKTASFHVDPTFQSWKCFGCGLGGDVFDFIERMENLSFVEAAEKLARRVGLDFERKGKQGATSERDQIAQVNQVAARLFREFLAESDVAKQYLKTRRISLESQEKFQIGYSPESWSALAEALRRKGVSDAVAISAGLIRKNRNGELSDVFRSRLMFPIIDAQDRIVGFGGRALGVETPKYLNSSQTALFDKGKTLYGLSQSRKSIARADYALLMEGYIDVVAAHQAGFSQAVAGLGTALTPEHGALLARYCSRVVACYDGDEAGRKAAVRAAEVLTGAGLEVKIARIRAGEDPDSLLRDGKSEVFQTAIQKAVDSTTFQIENLISSSDLSQETGKEAFFRRALPIVARLNSAIERERFVGMLAPYHPRYSSGITVAESQIRADIEGRRPQQTVGKGREWKLPQLAPRHTSTKVVRSADNRDLRASVKVKLPTELAERELVRALIASEWRQFVLDQVTEEDFQTPAFRRLYDVIRNATELHASVDVLDVIGKLDDAEFSSNIRITLQEIVEQAGNMPLTQASILDCRDRIRRQHREELRRRVSEMVRKQPVLTAEESEIVREYHRLSSELKDSDGVQPDIGGC